MLCWPHNSKPLLTAYVIMSLYTLCLGNMVWILNCWWFLVLPIQLYFSVNFSITENPLFISVKDATRNYPAVTGTKYACISWNVILYNTNPFCKVIHSQRVLQSTRVSYSQSLRELILKNEFVETNDKYPATHTHLGTQKQLTVKSKRSGFRKKWHISIKKTFKNGF